MSQNKPEWVRMFHEKLGILSRFPRVYSVYIALLGFARSVSHLDKLHGMLPSNCQLSRSDRDKLTSIYRSISRTPIRISQLDDETILEMLTEILGHQSLIEYYVYRFRTESTGPFYETDPGEYSWQIVARWEDIVHNFPSQGEEKLTWGSVPKVLPDTRRLGREEKKRVIYKSTLYGVTVEVEFFFLQERRVICPVISVFSRYLTEELSYRMLQTPALREAPLSIEKPHGSVSRYYMFLFLPFSISDTDSKLLSSIEGHTDVLLAETGFLPFVQSKLGELGLDKALGEIQTVEAFNRSRQEVIRST